MTEGDGGCTCKMNFSSPEKFNALIDENKPGLPGKNPVQLLPFLLGPFTQLTNRLTELLRPSEEALKDRAFFEKSTVLTMYTIAGAISALANTDSISQISASYTVDGEVSLGIRDVAQVTISVRDHHFTTLKAPAEHPQGRDGIRHHRPGLRPLHRPGLHHQRNVQGHHPPARHALHGG